MTDETLASPDATSPAEGTSTTPDLWQTHRPPFILSFVEADNPNGGFVIGWDTCGSCNLHIRSCKCATGPSQPNYVKRWRSQSDTEHDKAKPVSAATRKAVVTADPAEVAAKVEESTGTVSRVRYDPKTGKRSPARRTSQDPSATPDSVADAAGNLAGAMKEQK